jgi:leucyl/phenylalanyl-tRNA---protein transferase
MLPSNPKSSPSHLDDRLWFPEPGSAIRQGPLAGLVAVGGDLSIDRLLLAYRSGLFPWTEDPITWWSPDPRGIIELDRLHVPRSLDRVLRAGRFETTFDTAFERVIRACAAPMPRREDTWITPGFVAAYTALHRAGHAHSVECWDGDHELVGGIYGVAIGGFFAGESMFHRQPDASKVALVRLVERLRAGGFRLLDVQMLTSVVRAMGGSAIPREEYLNRLGQAVAVTGSFR